MSLAPENADERRFLYNTDPTFGMVMDALVRMAVEDEADKRRDIAHDFFLYGVTVVTTDGNKVLILDPAMCEEDGEEIIARPPSRGEVRIAFPLILRVEGNHPVPCFEAGMLKNVGPWLREWDRAKTELGGFIQERLGR